MKKILNKLFEHQSLDRDEAAMVLRNIAEEAYPPAQVSAFITVYLMRSVTVEELTGFRDTLLELCTPIDLEGREAIDLCGTGGDGKNTFNISTTASFVVAGAGFPVAKHGNYAVSSSCGSSNIMEELGYHFPTSEEQVLRHLDACNYCFLHAPLFHPALKAVSGIRRTLGVKTFFNMLGPLVNPTRPTTQLVGVFNLRLARLYKHLFESSEMQYCIVHSLDGYDEISLTGAFKTISASGEEIYTPGDIGLQPLHPDQLAGRENVPESAQLILDILDGKGTAAQENVVLVNAAYAIRCIKTSESIESCFALAKESLDSKRARSTLEKCISFSQN